MTPTRPCGMCGTEFRPIRRSRHLYCNPRCVRLRKNQARREVRLAGRAEMPKPFSPESGDKPMRLALAEPIRVRIQQSIKIDQAGCWRWKLNKDTDGYGRIQILKADGGSRSRPAHRIAYAEWRGEIPEGMEIDHLCRVRDCVNPEHLEAVTHAENTLRSYALPALNARKTHCVHGHEFSEANTYVTPGGARSCRACQRATQARCRQRKLSEASRG